MSAIADLNQNKRITGKDNSRKNDNAREMEGGIRWSNWSIIPGCLRVSNINFSIRNAAIM